MLSFFFFKRATKSGKGGLHRITFFYFHSTDNTITVFSMRTDEDLKWKMEEGVPRVDDPFIQKYLQGRDALVEEEHRQRHG